MSSLSFGIWQAFSRLSCPPETPVQKAPPPPAEPIRPSDPRPVREILKRLDESLAVFNDGFLSRRLRDEIWWMLKIKNDPRSITDIFYSTDFSLSEAYEGGFFREAVYRQENAAFMLDVSSYLDQVTRTIDGLEAQGETLRRTKEITRDEQRRTIDRIEAIVSVLRRPIPMMQQLQQTAVKKGAAVIVGKA